MRGARIRELADLDASSSTSGLCRILLLADYNHPANVVRDHVKAITSYSRHDYSLLNPIACRSADGVDFNHYDLIIIHYSVCVIKPEFLSETIAEKIRKFPGPKIQFIQDECRWIDRMASQIARLGISMLFSSLSKDNVARVYRHPGLRELRFVSCLPGYVPENLLTISKPRTAERPFHVVYRGRDLPFWLGEFARDKVTIGRRFVDAANGQLKFDVKWNEDDRIYGDAWTKFMMSGKSTLATEGGASIFDFDGSAEKLVQDFCARNPGASFEEVHRSVLLPYEGNVVHKTITPRIFEAIALKCGLVLFPGAYRGVLERWRHYIPFEKDGSNYAEVIGLLKDDSYIEDLACRTYEEVGQAEHLSMRYFVSQIDAAIEELMAESVRKLSTGRHSTHRAFGSRRGGKVLKLQNDLLIRFDQFKFRLLNFLSKHAEIVGKFIVAHLVPGKYQSTVRSMLRDCYFKFSSFRENNR